MPVTQDIQRGSIPLSVAKLRSYTLSLRSCRKVNWIHRGSNPLGRASFLCHFSSVGSSTCLKSKVSPVRFREVAPTFSPVWCNGSHAALRGRSFTRVRVRFSPRAPNLLGVRLVGKSPDSESENLRFESSIPSHFIERVY